MRPSRHRNPAASSGATTLLGLAGALGVTGAAYATLVEPRWFALRHLSLPLLGTDAAGGLRILHLSDLHLQPRHRHVRAFLERCATTEPDVVVITGDLLGHPDVVEQAADLMAPLAAGRHGLFVLGSNDVFGPTTKNPLAYLRAADERRRPQGVPLDTSGLVEGLVAAGWQQVDNRRLRVTTRAGPVDVIGLGDAHIGADEPGRVSWSPPPGDVVLALGVAHSPYRRVLDPMDRAGLDLALAGHTHGGQVRMPGYGALVANCDLPLRQARGLSGYGAGLTLHVSAGLGASRYAPFRFACRPEATVLDLVPA